MLGIERRKAIMERLKRDRRVHVNELAKDFRITKETVRRDLENLEKKGLLRRSYGGAVLVEHTSEDLSFQRRTATNAELKDSIGRTAAALVGDGDTIMMDSSTTALALCRHLLTRRDVTIITNAVRVLSDFSGAPFTLISTGGKLRAKSSCLVGPVACATLGAYHVDYAIISCKAASMESGIMESNEEESVVKKTMMARAKKVILLVDHTKLDKLAFAAISDFEKITTLVTDRDPGRKWRSFLERHQVELIIGASTKEPL